MHTGSVNDVHGLLKANIYFSNTIILKSIHPSYNTICMSSTFRFYFVLFEGLCPAYWVLVKFRYTLGNQ